MLDNEKQVIFILWLILEKINGITPATPWRKDILIT